MAKNQRFASKNEPYETGCESTTKPDFGKFLLEKYSKLRLFTKYLD
jgi:hypothetical protein